MPAVVLSLRERISGELDRSLLERVYFPGDLDYVMLHRMVKKQC